MSHEFAAPRDSLDGFGEQPAENAANDADKKGKDGPAEQVAGILKNMVTGDGFLFHGIMTFPCIIFVISAAFACRRPDPII